MPQNSNCVRDHEASKDWHIVVVRCPESGNFGSKFDGNCLFESKFAASKYAKAATKADGRRRLVAKVVRRYKKPRECSVIRDDYMN